MEAYKLGFLLGHAMDSKKWWVFGIACLSIIAAYQVGKFAGENTAEVRLSEKQLAFQKEREATHKAEFAKLLRIYKEEKQAEERLRREEKKAEFDRGVAKLLKESKDKQMALYMKLIENLMQVSQYQPRGREPVPPLLFDELIKDYLVTNPKAPPVADQYQVFETTTIDGWVKRIKRGTIFKTTSGNIYEVCEAVILFEMELRPKVTVLTDGQFYKLLIQGVNEELLCKKLNPGNARKGSGSVVIEARITNDFDGLEHGNIYKLDNGQVWEQTDSYIYIHIAVMPRATIWQDGSVHKLKVEGIDKVVTVKQVK